jgi:hypothetical protein
MKLLDILREQIDFRTYEGMVQVIYDGSENTNNLAELLRALPGVTTVTTASGDGDNRETLKVKLISQKESAEAFEAFKTNALSKYNFISAIEIALTKTYFVPAKLNCLITRGDQVVSIDDFTLPDLQREASFAFLRPDLADISVVPEVGDIINWQEDYYVVDTVRENQLMLGRDKSYNLTSYGNKFGSSISIICDCHMTKRESTGIDFEGTAYL